MSSASWYRPAAKSSRAFISRWSTSATTGRATAASASAATNPTTFRLFISLLGITTVSQLGRLFFLLRRTMGTVLLRMLAAVLHVLGRLCRERGRLLMGLGGLADGGQADHLARVTGQVQGQRRRYEPGLRHLHRQRPVGRRPH